MAECIHGFDEGLCDICFPRQVPEPPPTVASAATRSATRPAPVRAPRRTAPANRPAGSGPKIASFATRRLYHPTHLRNLESILLDGELRAIGAGLTPDVDPVAPIVRGLRERAVADGRPVAEFVPFALSPDAERWAELRSGAEGAQWAPLARTTTAADYAVLVAVAKDLGEELVVADGDAGAPATRFTTSDPARAVAQAARHDPELLTAEILVPGPVPVSALNLIAVANEPTRARVRGMFADVEGSAPRVVVHPPWFGA